MAHWQVANRRHNARFRLLWRGLPRHMLAQVAAAVLITHSATGVHAQSTDTSNLAAARKLFEDGLAFGEAGRQKEACAKFEASSKLYRSAGPLLHVAECRAREGKLATAWGLFKDAAHLARIQNKPNVARIAERRARELKPQLPYLRLHVPEGIAGLQVVLDGRGLPPAALGTPMPVNPGVHSLRAQADGRIPWSTEITMVPADRQEVSVPELALAPPPPEPKPAAPDPAASKPAAQKSAAAHPTARAPVVSAQAKPPATPIPGHDAAPQRPSTLPWVVGGFGVASAVVGGLFGVLALMKNSDLEGQCDSVTRECRTEEALKPQGSRDTYAVVANVGLGLGIAGVATGVVLFLGDARERPGTTPPRVQLRPQVTAAGPGLSVAGVF